MGRATAYYTDDVVCMPIKMLWRVGRHSVSPTLVMPIFLYFCLCKLLGWRRAANYGAARPSELDRLAFEDLPDLVREASRPYVEACETAGFTRIGSYQSEYIGQKEGYSTVLVHVDDRVYATVIWIKLSRGPFTASRTIFSCHSHRTDSEYIETGSIAIKDWHPELFPPWCYVHNAGPDVPPETVIRSHFEHIATESNLVRFDQESLWQQLLVKYQALFDFMIAKGFYVKLKESEVDRLVAEYGPNS